MSVKEWLDTDIDLVPIMKVLGIAGGILIVLSIIDGRFYSFGRSNHLTSTASVSQSSDRIERPDPKQYVASTYTECMRRELARLMPLDYSTAQNSQDRMVSLYELEHLAPVMMAAAEVQRSRTAQALATAKAICSP
jgi:hypothetical protein